MTALATTLHGGWLTISSGKLGFARYYTYLGLITGLSILYYFGTSDYGESATQAQLLLWGGVGAGAGLLGSLALAAIQPARADSKAAKMFLPWLDGAVLMLLLTGVWILMSPGADALSYEDQSLLFSPKIVTAMYVLYFLSGILYLTYLFAPESAVGRMGTSTAWMAVYLGGSALLLRWYESYLIDPEIGHAPVSNLFEVFVLLFAIASIVYLCLERRFNARALGSFVMPMICGGVFFAIYLQAGGGGEIKPLVPALQSYWMKIHVPLNFIGYGAFGVACGAGLLYLFREKLEKGGSKARLLSAMPTLEQTDDLIYYAVIIGYPAFTLATILGAAWAAEAWGGYWSWDPKETWALIVWLVYGAFLHVRISHGWRGRPLALWAVAGFVVTLFCFIGVNMYLSGLHSYGSL